MPVIGLIILILFGCKSKEEVELSKVEIEILGLQSIQNKRDYLETIFKDDQKLRTGKGSEIMLKYGEDSKEYREHGELLMKQDEENLDKIEKYLKSYGHPKQSEVGEIAAITPWAVIHHANGYESRERNFETLYKAYLNGDIDENAFSMFLGRMYEMKNGEPFSMERPYKSEDEINQLIEKLDLTKKVNAQ